MSRLKGALTDPLLSVVIPVFNEKDTIEEILAREVYHLDNTNRMERLWQIFEETHKTKLVVFCAIRASIANVVNYFQEKHIKVGQIHGDVDHKIRARLIDAFQNSDLQVLVIQPQSSAHGITLTAANVIVWYSLVPSGETYRQANGRITRAGQTRKQLIINMIGCKAEQRILGILNSKAEMSNAILTLFNDL